ncbi:MAG TPA: hypothetical protein VHD33_03125, partial [Legionellaceae bacterium]|nr:hypothetical protein [Legionellaceae bacterium]
QYYTGEKVAQSYTNAKLLYEAAINLDPHYALAYRNLGVIFEHGRGLDAPEIVKAVRYYQQAIDKNYSEAHHDLQALLDSPQLTADQLNSIAVLYHEGKEVKQDYIKAKSLYEKVISKDPQYSVAYRNLGVIFEDGLGLNAPDLIKAVLFYQQAIDKSENEPQHNNELKQKIISKNAKYARAYRSFSVIVEQEGDAKGKTTPSYQQAVDINQAVPQHDLTSLLDSPKLTAAQLNSIAVLYHNGKEVKQDYAKAKLLYEKAISRDAQYGAAYRNLGLIFKLAYGLSAPDLVKAVLCFQQAIDRNYVEAQNDLQSLLASSSLTADQLNHLAVLYKDGKEVKQNSTKATSFSEQSIALNNSFLSLLKKEFKLEYPSIDVWLDDITQPNSKVKELRSEQTGNTMLHMVFQCSLQKLSPVEKVQKSAKALSQLKYVRNGRHELPLALLKNQDPYQLKPIIYTEGLVKMGKELDKLESMLNTIKTKTTVANHFILLEGPPGTGKTVAVKNHLATLGYTVNEWMRGVEEDRFV